MRGIFGPIGDEVTGEWRGMHNLYCSHSIIRIIKSGRVRWAGLVILRGAKGIRLWLQIQKEREN
jgi:hypothetical protein